MREFTYLENRGLSELLESRASILQKINQKKEEETPQINSIDAPLFPQFPNLTKRNLLRVGDFSNFQGDTIHHELLLVLRIAKHSVDSMPSLPVMGEECIGVFQAFQCPNLS